MKNDNEKKNDKQLKKVYEPNSKKNSIDKTDIKTEKQKKEEILEPNITGKVNKETIVKPLNSIIAIVLVLVLSLFTVCSVVIAGNLSNNNVSITSNLTNTRIVQAKLAELGYFKDDIDGIFDDGTISAVKAYQSEKNLTVTGNLDSATTTALGVTDNTQANTDLYLLAKLIYSEARGEQYEGQVAVGAVVLNRVDDAGFPNTLQGVIYQPWAFTALHDGQFSLEPNSTAYQAAQDAMNGWDPTYGCLYYYNPTTATSSWIFSRQIIVTIGNHVFCL